MFKNLKWLRLVPDAPGKGGQKTGFHTFQAQPVNDIRRLLGFHVYRGSWRKDYASQAVPATSPDVGFYTVEALHPYTYPSLTDPSAQPGLTLLGHHFDGGGPTNRYWDFTNNTARDVHAGNSVPATFLNIEGRCFVADGAREGMILDDRTAAIHTQPNQNLGIGTPTQPLSGTLGGNITGYGTGYVHLGSPYINHPNPKNKIGTIVSTDYINVNNVNSGYGGLYDNGALMADGLPIIDAVSSDTSTFTAAGTISITSGTSLVTLAGATWPANYAYCGLAINFNGYSYVILSHGVLLLGNGLDLNGDMIALSNVQLLIMGVYDGPTVTNVPYTITGCQVGPITNPANTSGATTLNTAIGRDGYSQSTASNLVQVLVRATRNGAAGAFRNLGNISLSPESLDGAAIGSIEYVTDGSLADGKRSLTSATAPWLSEDEGLPIFVDEADSTGGILTTTITTFIATGNVRLGAANTSGVSLVGTGQVWWGSAPVITDGAMVAGPGTVILTSASNPFVSGDVGQPIVVEFAGNAAGTKSLITTIQVFNNAGSVTLANPSLLVAGFTGARVWWKGISTLTTAGPTYSYAWYDPETGHVSNIAPLYQIPRPTEIGNYVDFANMTPLFQVDPGYISYPSGVDATRFSHILFFRTLSTPNSSTLYPIGSMMPFVGKVHPGSASTRGSWSPSGYHGWMGAPNNYVGIPPFAMGTAPNFWLDFSSDEDLVLTGGFRAPQFTNEKPMALLRGGITEPAKVAHQAYWDRRLWCVATQDPDKIMFSCDEAQCPLGIPVESFPPTNFLRIPSVDGRVLGMKLIADMLLITTERWAYTVAGNNESNYRLLRVSTRMGGIGTYQMDELTSDVEGQSSIVYFLGRDKIVYEWMPGGQVNAISASVQDVLNTHITTLASYDVSRVHCVSAWARRLVVVKIGPYGMMLTFDVVNRVWSQNYTDDGSALLPTGLAAMATIYGMDPPVNEIYSAMDHTGNEVVIRSWIRDDGVTPQFGGSYIDTFPMDFDGKKVRKALKMVNAHVSTDSGGQWGINTWVNEADIKYAVLAPYVDPLYSIYGATGFDPVDATAPKDIVVLTAALNSTGTERVGYRFRVQLNPSGVPALTVPSIIYAIDIGYEEWEEPGEGDP